MFIYPFKNKIWGMLDAIWTCIILHYTNSLCIINFLCVPKNRLWCKPCYITDHLKYYTCSVDKIEYFLFLVVEVIIQYCFLVLTNTPDSLILLPLCMCSPYLTSDKVLGCAELYSFCVNHCLHCINRIPSCDVLVS
jgi:hypothetical protein